MAINDLDPNYAIGFGPDLSEHLGMKIPEGYAPVQGLPFNIGSNRRLFSDLHGEIKMLASETQKKLWGTVRFNNNFEGPPGHTHGGAQAYVLDEAMGTVCWSCNIPVVARSIQIDFKRMVPLNKEIIVTADMITIGSPEVLITASLMDSDQSLFAFGSGRFHIITYQQFSTLIGPAAEVNFSRWFPDPR